MPLIRRLLQSGDSLAVTIPKSWLREAENREGKKIVAIAMEVNGHLTLFPIFEKNAEPTTSS